MMRNYKTNLGRRIVLTSAAISFSLRHPIPPGAVLVDDVLTSGATVTSAIDVADIHQISVITATSVGTMRSGADPPLDRGGAVAQKRQRM